MGRRPRIDVPGGIHHVMNRGVDRGAIFFGDVDRVEFGSRLAAIHERFGVETLAYCLMPNHFHLLLHAPSGGLAKSMHHLALAYTRHTNDRVQRDGPIFRGRYHSILVETDAYLMCAVRYIHRNPLALAGVTSAMEFRWSSYRTYLGMRRPPPFLVTGPVMAMFGNDGSRLGHFTDAGELDGPDLDVSTALQLARLARGLSETEPGSDGGPSATVTERQVLAVMAGLTPLSELRSELLRLLDFPTDSARRKALGRARALADHPAVRAAIPGRFLRPDEHGRGGRAA